MLDTFLPIVISFALFFASGVYVGHIGVSGLKTDLALLKQDIRNIEAKFHAPAQITAIAVPVEKPVV